MERWILRGAAIGAILAVLPMSAAAQVRAPTTIQLPTFNFFTVNTTVEVPDSGGAVLGGVGSAASGRTERGIPGLGSRPFDSVASSGARGAGGMSVSTEIHDFEAMDRQLLGGDFNNSADARAIKSLPLMLRPAANGMKPSGLSALATDSTGGQSVAEIRRQQAEEDLATQREAERLFAQASELQTAGKPGVAKIYFQMAAHRATGDLKDRALAAIRELSKPTQSASAGRQSP